MNRSKSNLRICLDYGSMGSKTHSAVQRLKHIVVTCTLDADVSLKVFEGMFSVVLLFLACVFHFFPFLLHSSGTD